MAVAFLKDGGALHIFRTLESRLKAGASAEAVIGTDFHITEPRALARLRALDTRDEASAIVRTLIETVTIMPAEDGEPEAEVVASPQTRRGPEDFSPRPLRVRFRLVPMLGSSAMELRVP